ncbi:hypothetical protein BHM03_00050629 [Ensete ventricosum]|nr:hypothetical protein BHM03_00050629 [Ensete ventricosum]
MGRFKRNGIRVLVPQNYPPYDWDIARRSHMELRLKDAGTCKSLYSGCCRSSVPSNLIALVAYPVVVRFHHARRPCGWSYDRWGIGLICARSVARPLAPPYLRPTSFPCWVGHVGGPVPLVRGGPELVPSGGSGTLNGAGADSTEQELGNLNVARADPTEQELGNWDVARADPTEQELGNWDVARADPTEQELGNWDVARADPTEQELGNWDVARADPTEQELGNWNVARADPTEQELGNWNVAGADPSEQELGN